MEDIRVYLDLEIENLVGKKITSMFLHEDKKSIKLLTTTNMLYTLSWWGDCCSDCYIETLQNHDALRNAEITSIEHKTYKVTRDMCDVIESMGTTIKTSKGYVDIETRLEHNGYYSGYVHLSEDDISSESEQELISRGFIKLF